MSGVEEQGRPAVLRNTAGEEEREKRSRRANGTNAFAAECGLLLVLWPFCLGWGVLGQAAWVSVVGKTAVFLGFLWALVGSPLWHGDALETMGLGNPWRLRELVRHGSGPERWQAVAVCAAIFVGLLWFSFADWPDAARFFRLPKSYQVWPHTALSWVGIGALAVAAAGVVTLFAVRYDNLGPVFGLAWKIVVIFLAYAALAAWCARGPRAFARFEWREHMLDVSAYIFWGLIQQLTFTAFFATRLRKAMGPSLDPANRVTPRHRWVAVIIGAVVAGVSVGPAMWLALRAASGAPMPLATLAGCSAFALPAGAVWTWFFCGDKRRMLVATLTGIFFGVIHIDSYGLVLLTTILGTTLAYAAMEDRFRNLAAFACVHGVLGATVLKFFAGKGLWHISLSVGPWAVKHPSGMALIAPLLCCAAFAGLGACLLRRTPG